VEEQAIRADSSDMYIPAPVKFAFKKKKDWSLSANDNVRARVNRAIGLELQLEAENMKSKLTKVFDNGRIVYKG